MTKVNEGINDNEEQKIDVETESNDLVAEVQNDGEANSKPEQRNNVDLQKVKVENNVNPLFYEIGPFPRKPPKVWIQYIEGQALDYSPDSRNAFVKLVFSLVLMMLICTAAICYVANVVEPVKNLFLNPRVSAFFVILAATTTMAMSYAFSCSACTRMAPCSYICLLITAIAFGVICAYFSVKYETHAVFLAVASTTVVVLVCLGLACTSFDFTKCILFLIVAMAAFMAASLVVFIYMSVTGVYIKPLHIAYLIIGTVLYSFLLVMELQMILGGRSVELSEDDYAYGAFAVYTSIINIFLNLLQLLSFGDM